MVGLGLGLTGGLAVLGLPLGLAIIGGLMVAMLLYDPVQITGIPSTMLNSVNDPTLVALPLFIIAGAMVAESGLVEPIVDIGARILRRLPGGLGLTAIATALFFAGSTGSSAGEAATISRALFPSLRARGYPPGFTGALITAAAALGILFPPSITLIVFATLVQYPVQDLWIAGLVPGLVGAALMAVVAVSLGRRYERGRPTQVNGVDDHIHLTRAIPAGIMPVLVLGGIYSGILTVSETATVLLAYVVLYSAIVRRQSLRELSRSFAAGGELAGMIFLIVVAAHVMTQFLLLSGVGQSLITTVANAHLSKVVVLLIINLVLLGLGTLMDGLSLLIVAVPLVYPLLQSLGMSPVEVAVMMCMNIEVGVAHPPIGMNLVAVSGVTGVPVGTIAWRVLPFIAVLLLMLAAVTYGPMIGLTWLH